MPTTETRSEDMLLNVLSTFLGVALLPAPWYLQLVTRPMPHATPRSAGVLSRSSRRLP